MTPEQTDNALAGFSITQAPGTSIGTVDTNQDGVLSAGDALSGTFPTQLGKSSQDFTHTLTKDEVRHINGEFGQRLNPAPDQTTLSQLGEAAGLAPSEHVARILGRDGSGELSAGDIAQLEPLVLPVPESSPPVFPLAKSN